MTSITHTFDSDCIVSGIPGPNSIPSTLPIKGIRQNGNLTQITRGGDVWEIWSIWQDPNFDNATTPIYNMRVNSQGFLVVHPEYWNNINYIGNPLRFSSDLINWTTPTFVDPSPRGTDWVLQSVSYQSTSIKVLYDHFIIIRKNTILVSPDGINWSIGTMPTLPGFGNTTQFYCHSLEDIPGNKIQALVSKWIGYGYGANQYHTFLLESADIGLTWTIKSDLYDTAYINYTPVHDPLNYISAQAGVQTLGEVRNVAYNKVDGIIEIVLREPWLDTLNYRSHDFGATWFTDESSDYFRSYNDRTRQFSLMYGNGKWVCYKNYQPYDYPFVSGWYFIDGNDWSTDPLFPGVPHGRQFPILFNGQPLPNWNGSQGATLNFDGTHWIYTNDAMTLQSTDLVNWVTIPTKLKMFAYENYKLIRGN